MSSVCQHCDRTKPIDVCACFFGALFAVRMLHVLQVLWSAVSPASGTLAPSLVGAAAAALWLKQQPSPEKQRAAIAQLPGLCATAMFTLSPLPQLVRCLPAGSYAADLSML